MLKTTLHLVWTYFAEQQHTLVKSKIKDKDERLSDCNIFGSNLEITSYRWLTSLLRIGILLSGKILKHLKMFWFDSDISFPNWFYGFRGRLCEWESTKPTMSTVCSWRWFKVVCQTFRHIFDQICSLNVSIICLHPT